MKPFYYGCYNITVIVFLINVVFFVFFRKVTFYFHHRIINLSYQFSTKLQDYIISEYNRTHLYFTVTTCIC